MKILDASHGRRTAEIVRTLSDSFDTAKDEAVTRSPVDDDELLDGYSLTVSGVVEKVKPAVVNIRVRQSERERGPTQEKGGSGSGFIIAPDGFLLAYGASVARGRQQARAAVVDVVPTILYFLGLPIGRDMDGYARTDLFQRLFTDERPITFIPTYDR